MSGSPQSRLDSRVSSRQGGFLLYRPVAQALSRCLALHIANTSKQRRCHNGRGAQTPAGANRALKFDRRTGRSSTGRFVRQRHEPRRRNDHGTQQRRVINDKQRSMLLVVHVTSNNSRAAGGASPCNQNRPQPTTCPSPSRFISFQDKRLACNPCKPIAEARSINEGDGMVEPGTTIAGLGRHRRPCRRGQL